MIKICYASFGLRLILLSLGSLIFFGSLTNAQLLDQTERTWVDSTGKYQVIATLVEFEGGIAVLRKKNGVKVKLPLDQLSGEDQKYLKSLAMTSPATGSDSTPTESNLLPADNQNQLPTSPPTSPQPIELGLSHFDSTDVPPSPISPAQPPTSTDSTVAEVTPAINEGSPQPPLLELDKTGSSIAAEKFSDDVTDGSSMTQMLAEQQIPALRKQLAKLLKSWPNNPTPELIAAVTNASQTNDKFVRKLALQVLSKYRGKDSLQVFIRLMDDPSFDVRWTAYEAIETLNDDRAIDALIERFTGEDSGRIGSILVSYGPRAEEKVASFLHSEQSKNVRLSALSLLARIGTEKSIPAIEKVQLSAEDSSTRIQAEASIARIRERQAVEQPAGQQP